MANSRPPLAFLDDDEKADVHIAGTGSDGGHHGRTAVAGSGLYALMFKSRKPLWYG